MILFNRVLVDDRHHGVWLALIILVIECLKASLDIIELHDWVAKVRFVAIEYSVLQLCLVPLKGHAIVCELHSWLPFANLFRCLGHAPNPYRGAIFVFWQRHNADVLRGSITLLTKANFAAVNRTMRIFYHIPRFF